MKLNLILLMICVIIMLEFLERFIKNKFVNEITRKNLAKKLLGFCE